MIRCWISGGRDSALACYIAKRAADARGWDFRLVFIDTTIAIRETVEYVHRYAEWLGAELDVIRPRMSFEEYAMRYPYWPLLWHLRWCYYKLKRGPAAQYMCQNQSALHVLGIRANESLFRMGNYTSTFAVLDREKCKVKTWYPILHLDSVTRDRLIKKFGIPESPVWRKVGISGDCLCLAGTSEKTLRLIILNYPEETQRLLKIDEIIQTHKKSPGTSYPAPLVGKRIPLRDFVEQVRRTPTLDQFFGEEYGKKCDACII